MTEDNIEEVLTDYPVKYHDALRDYVEHLWYPEEMRPIRVRQKYLTKYFKDLEEDHCYECTCSAEDFDHCNHRVNR